MPPACKHVNIETWDHRVVHTHTPDTRSKPVVRRSLFRGLLYLLGIFKVPQNAIRVDIRVILSGYSLKPEKANNELHRLWMSIHGISRLSAS